MSPELLIALLIGCIMMCGVIILQMKWYSVDLWKSIVVSFALAITGFIGSEIWFFVENLSLGGRSFYGAIAFAPLIFWPISRWMKIPYLQCLDFCCTGGCMALAAIKVQCLRDGCCGGYIMHIDENHMYVRFPSQIVEMANFIAISAILLVLSRRIKYREKIFPIFLTLYGLTRFFLDFFRGETVPYALGLTAGSFWSLCSFAVGLIWLTVTRKKAKDKG